MFHRMQSPGGSHSKNGRRLLRAGSPRIPQPARKSIASGRNTGSPNRRPTPSMRPTFSWPPARESAGYTAPAGALPPVPPVLFLNGMPYAGDTPPVMMAGHLYVPLRAISESYGLHVLYDATERKITMEHQGFTYTLFIDGKASVNGHELFWPAPAARVIDARTYIPFDLLARCPRPTWCRRPPRTSPSACRGGSCCLLVSRRRPSPAPGSGPA